jgi:cytochrome c peroxidase
MKRIISTLLLAAMAALITPAARAEDWTWQLPKFIPEPRIPADNPMSPALVELGRHLFYDKRLSGNGTTACSTCHIQALAFTDGKPRSPGSTGEKTARNSPSIANSAWNATYTWANPALTTLERQMEVPLFGDDPIEMGVTDSNRQTIVRRIEAEPLYPVLFHDAFPDVSAPITFANIIKSIAAFQRSVISVNSRYDRYLQRKEKLSEAERRGMRLFFGERAECHHCHGSFNFNDQVVHARSRDLEILFHNTGLYNIDGTGAYPFPNRGLFEFSAKPEDMGAFRAPSLRNVALTAPYMHDGSVATLGEVLDLYSQGGRVIRSGALAGDGRQNPHKDGLIARIDLTAEEKQDLLAFLETLTDESLLSNPQWSDPWATTGNPL